MKPVIVLINNRDLLSSVQRQIEYFRRVPNAYIVLCDNASTYPPLLDFYDVCKHYTGSFYYHSEFWLQCPCSVNWLPNRIHFFPENRGPRGSQTILDRVAYLIDFDYYFMSDADMDYSSCDPSTLFPDLIQGLVDYPYIQGCGVSIRIDDLPETPLLDAVRTYESGNWKDHPRLPETALDPPTPYVVERYGSYWDDRWFTGGTDTAGVMRRASGWDGRYEGFRSTKHVARHEPWYFVPANWICPTCASTQDYKTSVGYCPTCVNVLWRPADYEWYYAHADGKGTVYTSKVLDIARENKS